MTENWTADTSHVRYGPLAFAVTVAHIFVVDLATWLFIPWSIVFILPVVLVYMVIAALIARRPGKAGQVGRGMFLGSLSGPLSLAIFVPVWAIAHAVGPI